MARSKVKIHLDKRNIHELGDVLTIANASDDCNACWFNKNTGCHTAPACASHHRYDGEDVVWKRIR